MHPGSLVTYGHWYTGNPRTGIVLKAIHEASATGIPSVEFVLVMWENTEMEWEEVSELEVIQ